TCPRSPPSTSWLPRGSRPARWRSTPTSCTTTSSLRPTWSSTAPRPCSPRSGRWPDVRVVAAPDKFRGTAAAADVAAAIGRAADASGWRCDQVPVADGGDGLLDVLGGPNRTSVVTGPLGDPVEAGWRYDRGTAVIEM